MYKLLLSDKNNFYWTSKIKYSKVVLETLFWFLSTYKNKLGWCVLIYYYYYFLCEI